MNERIDFYKIRVLLRAYFTQHSGSVLILRMHGEISRKAYLKVVNNSEYELENLTVNEPDKKRDWGTLDQDDSKVIYIYPNCASTEDDQYSGISQNYLMITFNGTLEEQIRIVHPGEVHEIILDKNLNLESVHLNKIIFNKRLLKTCHALDENHHPRHHPHPLYFLLRKKARIFSHRK